MIELFEHQKVGIEFLVKHPSALLADCMGLGKTRQSLVAAQRLFEQGKIDRVLVLAPAAVRYSWRTEIDKLEADDMKFIPCVYEPKKQAIYGGTGVKLGALPVALISYALLPQKRHVEALKEWCEDGKTILIADESSFCKNRTAKQTKGAAILAAHCTYRWLLTGTPVANSPLDLYGQALVMSPGNGNGHNWNARAGDGPLRQFKNFYHFRSRYAQLQPMHIGRRTFSQVVGYQNIDELTAKFAPYVLRREKKDCLDLPPKTYTIREVALSEHTWRVYQELKRDALLALPSEDVRPEPNAVTRILRLAQLTSGHVGGMPGRQADLQDVLENNSRDVSSEKLDWLVEALLDGELLNEQAMIVWCRWRRERERLAERLRKEQSIDVYEIYGGQSQKSRDEGLEHFQQGRARRRILLAQQHAGGFGLNLTAASTAVYLSNSFSYTDRIQSEDRCHRIGQRRAVTYIDILATGPKGQKTVDHHVLDCLRAKQDIAALTCGAWRRILE
jgi:SNF2 family DNA or RNA helicase